MRRLRPADLQDSKVPEKIVLSGLWVSLLFVFAFVDIFGFWRADVIRGALAGEVPGVGLQIDQTFLTLTTAYILVPSLMIVASLLLPARANRVANIIVSLLYLTSVVVTLLGESWTYYILGSLVETVLLLAIAHSAWTWPGHSPLGHSPATVTLGDTRETGGAECEVSRAGRRRQHHA